MKKLTIIIPTFNEEKNIKNCLKSILRQKYPKEIIVVDGGSSDKTVKIAKKLGVKVIYNKYKVEEKGKPLGIKQAKGEIIGLLDADNIIPKDKDWLKNMIKPFDDEEIFATDTLYYTWRETDNFITKYCALIGGDDPIAMYFGINDRYNYFNGKSIMMNHKEEDVGEYIKVTLKKGKIPAFGSNGFFFRKKLFKGDIFIHPLFVKDLVDKGYNKIARVKQGIIHVQDGKIKTFFIKKLRRIKRRKTGEINWNYNYNITKTKKILISLYILSFILVIKDVIAAFFRTQIMLKQNFSWLFHPIAVYGLFFIYIYENLRK